MERVKYEKKRRENCHTKSILPDKERGREIEEKREREREEEEKEGEDQELSVLEVVF